MMAMYDSMLKDPLRPNRVAELQQVCQTVRDVYRQADDQAPDAMENLLRRQDVILKQLLPPGCLPYIHLSEKARNGKEFRPRIPKKLIQGHEDTTTKRVCFAQTIAGALSAMGDDLLALRHHKLYVHVPCHYDGRIYEPVSEVPDARCTGEVWFLDDVRLLCIACIRLGHRPPITDKPSAYEWGGETLSLYHWSYDLWDWLMPGEWARL